MEKGKLYLIPSPIGDSLLQAVIPQSNLYIMQNIRHFVVEEISTARRFLARAGLKEKIDSLLFYELNEHTAPGIGASYVSLLLQGNDVGLISEAGLPAVADPGADIVMAAHEHDIKVVPLVGPSSLMMALMASGLNGQSFAFCGYLPVKEASRSERLRSLERLSRRLNQSQIIIEAPYRNDALLHSILQSCSPSTLLTIAVNITMPTEYIKTKSIAQWKKEELSIGKFPAVFILLAREANSK